MVKIRLTRTGSKKKPTYRFIITPSQAPRDGRFIENIGHYDPHPDPATVVIQEDRLFHWLSVGAQPTDSVVSLLKSNGIWDRYLALKQGQPLPDQADTPEASVEDETVVEEVAEEAGEEAGEETGEVETA